MPKLWLVSAIVSLIVMGVAYYFWDKIAPFVWIIIFMIFLILILLKRDNILYLAKNMRYLAGNLWVWLLIALLLSLFHYIIEFHKLIFWIDYKAFKNSSYLYDLMCIRSESIVIWVTFLCLFIVVLVCKLPAHEQR